jgi:hypothetical protein
MGSSRAVVDRATERGLQQIREMIGPTADEVLAVHPGRFVIYALGREGAWVRICPTEELVRYSRWFGKLPNLLSQLTCCCFSNPTCTCASTKRLRTRR